MCVGMSSLAGLLVLGIGYIVRVVQTHPARANLILSPLSPTGRRASKTYFRLISAKWCFAGGFALDGPHNAGNSGLARTWVQPGLSGSVFLMAKSGRRASQGVSTKDYVRSKQNHTRFHEKNSPSVSTNPSTLSSATN